MRGFFLSQHFWFALAGVLFHVLSGLTGLGQPHFSGIYPHLAYWNSENECGTGAVVPWADRLWVITYAPHKPAGSTDKLYEIDSSLNQTICPESVGGTPANRMIHRESNQLFIGPYVIDAQGNVRVLTPQAMPGRLTGNARHLTNPAEKIYYATMEEGFYEVNVKTLAVKELYPDANAGKNPSGSLLPGYHGKGLYSGQGKLIYANNGERSPEAMRQPDIESGCLAEWDGKDWRMVRRNQFTEVTGPGGLYGNPHPASDPIWSIGWDHRSLLLMLRENEKWHLFRLPKASHCYDGAHGWNTEWPRIRDIGEADWLMTMHGMFWRFPQTFSAGNTTGLVPRSTYLKVVGDFCRWNDRVVFGCDDAAKSEFLNKRKAKGDVAGPERSQSNLWFVPPAELDHLGPARGAGAVWLRDAVKANEPSDAYLFSGFDQRAAHLAHNNAAKVEFTFEHDQKGNGQWKTLRKVTVPASGYAWIHFPAQEKGAWIRVRANHDVAQATVLFTHANEDTRSPKADAIFNGLSTVASPSDFSGGPLRAGGKDQPVLQFSAATVSHGLASEPVYYEMGEDLKLRRKDDAAAQQWLQKNTAVPPGVLTTDEASVIFTDERGVRFRLPKGDAAFAQDGALPLRVCREVCTERDLFQAHGTFYELPAENAGGLAKMRPVASHRFRITDYCSWRGLLVLSGVSAKAVASSHIVRSDDGKAAVWLGAVDDLWKLGKAVGHGGPWKNTPVIPGQPSDPYLCHGYDKKTLTLSHDASETVTIHLSLDLTGTGHWQRFQSFPVSPRKNVKFTFPAAWQAYWLRVAADKTCRATAHLVYE